MFSQTNYFTHFGISLLVKFLYFVASEMRKPVRNNFNPKVTLYPIHIKDESIETPSLSIPSIVE